MDDKLKTRVLDIQRKAIAYVDGIETAAASIPSYPLCDIVLFIGMKYLYIASKHNMAPREEIALEKKRLIASYAIAAGEYEREMYYAKLRNRISSQLVELERCGCEYCKKAVRIFDGRNTKEVK